MRITLNKKKDIIFKAEDKINTDIIKVEKIIDNNFCVIALISFPEFPTRDVKYITLWSGQDYIDLGDYKKADVKARLKELL